MYREKFFIVAVFVLLTGCSATGTRYSELHKPELNGQSEIVIYRASKIGASGSTFCTKVDGESIGVLQNGGYLRKTVIPGHHKISMPFDDSLAIGIESKPDETSYIEFTIGLSGMGVLPIGTVTAVSMSWDMALISTESEYSNTKLPNLKESKYSNTCTK